MPLGSVPWLSCMARGALSAALHGVEKLLTMPQAMHVRASDAGWRYQQGWHHLKDGQPPAVPAAQCPVCL
jgi:hypothetical protein